MTSPLATLSVLGSTLILAAAPALAQDAGTTAPLDLQVKTQLQTQQRSQLRLDQTADGTRSEALQQQSRTRLQTQTRTQTQAHRVLQDGSGAMQGHMGGGAARSGGQGGR